jgi:hypothetical protein
MSMRHRLTLAERIRGLRSALQAKRTPNHLRPFIKEKLGELEEQQRQERAIKRRSKPTLFDLFG